MLHSKPKTIPVTFGALGLIRKGTSDYLDSIPGKPSM